MIPPAFNSNKQAAAFGLLLLLLLASPWLAHKTFLPGREQTYSSQSIRWESFPWVQKFIYQETNDIDIVFVGSSLMCFGVYTPYVQQKLDEQLGRKTVVRTVSWFYPGFDSLYFFTKDLLAHRHVKMIVFYDECFSSTPYEVHKRTPQWFRAGEDADLTDLSLSLRTIYYYGAIIGMPRNLMELLVRNLPCDPSDQMTGYFQTYHSANPESQLGCMSAHLGRAPTSEQMPTKFLPYEPQEPANSDMVQVLSQSTATNFAFSDRPLPASQLYFAKQFGQLAKQNGCQLVVLHMPAFTARASSVIHESRDWSALLPTQSCLMGVPETRLFSELSEQQIALLYYDDAHMNSNGQLYFTKCITPVLIQRYEDRCN